MNDLGHSSAPSTPSRPPRWVLAIGPYVGLALVILLPLQKWIAVPKFLAIARDFGVEFSPLITAVDQLPLRVSLAVVVAAAVAVLVAARSLRVLLATIAVLLLINGAIAGAMALALVRLQSDLS